MCERISDACIYLPAFVYVRTGKRRGQGSYAMIVGIIQLQVIGCVNNNYGCFLYRLAAELTTYSLRPIIPMSTLCTTEQMACAVTTPHSRLVTQPVTIGSLCVWPILVRPCHKLGTYRVRTVHWASFSPGHLLTGIISLSTPQPLWSSLEISGQWDTSYQNCLHGINHLFNAGFVSTAGTSSWWWHWQSRWFGWHISGGPFPFPILSHSHSPHQIHQLCRSLLHCTELQSRVFREWVWTQQQLNKSSSLTVFWPDLYGEDCSVPCESHDNDTLGHFTCNSDGEMVCLEGYQNPDSNCTECRPAQGCCMCEPAQEIYFCSSLHAVCK